MSVAPSARYNHLHPCPICGGHERMPRGEGKRCTGFLSDDGAFAHCSREEVAGGIEVSPGSGTYGHKLQGACACGVTHNPLLSVVSAPDGRTSGPALRADVVATYDYRDEAGGLLFQVVRRADKTFYQRKPDGNGGWFNQIGDTRRVLYRLPEVLAADPARTVFVLEGEKDVDRAITMGLVATCNPHGAGQGKWKPAFSEVLRGRQVIVVADVDDEHTNPPHKGQLHARSIVAALAGVAGAARYLELPQHDFSDWADAGGTVGDLKTLVRVERDRTADTGPRFDAQPLKDLLARVFPPPKWAVPELIPHGLTLLAGNPKSGKSFLMLQMCLGIAYGGYVLGNIRVERGDVLYVDLENGEEVLQERAARALFGKACPENFYYVTQAPSLDKGLLAYIRAWMRGHPATRIIVLDTFEAVRPPEGGKAQNAYRADYAALRPLADVAKELRVAIVVIHHLSKSSGQVDDIFSRVNGSYGINGAVDNLMALGKQGGVTVLSATGRRVRAVERALNWDQETQQWTDGGDAAEARQSDTRKQILEALRDADESVFPSVVSNVTGLKAEVVRQRLFHMVRAGDVVTYRGKYQLNPLTNDPTPSQHNARNARNVQGEAGRYEHMARNGADLGVTIDTASASPIVTPLSSGGVTNITGVTGDRGEQRYDADDGALGERPMEDCTDEEWNERF